jgi:dihydroorotase-like cyclic amidohydrolase
VREPGNEEKEDWESCSKSALAGGITTIFAMPNTNPAVVNKDIYYQVKEIAEGKMVDLNCFTVESAMKMVAGTARSMGITVKGASPF